MCCANTTCSPQSTGDELDDLMMMKVERDLYKGSLNDVEYHLRRKENRSCCTTAPTKNSSIQTVSSQHYSGRSSTSRRQIWLPVQCTVGAGDCECEECAKRNCARSGALCITLRRLAYPNRWCNVGLIFGRHSSVMSTQIIRHMANNFKHLLYDCNNHDNNQICKCK